MSIGSTVTSTCRSGTAARLAPGSCAIGSGAACVGWVSGSARLFALTEIRRKVLTAQKQLADGIDPLAAKWAERAKHAAAADAPTFEQCATDYIAVAKAGWRDAKRAGQWERSLENYAFKTIGQMPVSAVTTDDVLHILKPIWTTKSETASKLRGRIENIIDWAVAKKFREPGPNPASWRGPLGKLLPSISKVQRTTHHPSVPYAEIPAFFAAVRAVGGVTADALAFTLLTVVRSGEARGAREREFDREAKTWTVPGARTKTRQGPCRAAHRCGAGAATCTGQARRAGVPRLEARPADE